MHELVSLIKNLHEQNGRVPTKPEMYAAGVSDYALRNAGGMNKLVEMAGLATYHEAAKKPKKVIKLPKILIFDLETAPIKAAIWGIWNQNVSINMIESDWHLLAWAAKWRGSKKVFYYDQQKAKDIENDKALIKPLWHLLDEADIVITWNGIKFDEKKINARFIKYGFPPPSPYRHIDGLRIARRKFGLTSNKLEFWANFLNVKLKKLTKRKFSGYELWAGCLNGVKAAWREMRVYCPRDVDVLELVIDALLPWDNSINWNVFHDSFDNICSCGSLEFKDNEKFVHTNAGRYAVLTCAKCGKSHTVKENLLSKEKRKALLK